MSGFAEEMEEATGRKRRLPITGPSQPASATAQPEVELEPGLTEDERAFSQNLRQFLPDRSPIGEAIGHDPFGAGAKAIRSEYARFQKAPEDYYEEVSRGSKAAPLQELPLEESIGPQDIIAPGGLSSKAGGMVQDIAGAVTKGLGRAGRALEQDIAAAAVRKGALAEKVAEGRELLAEPNPMVQEYARRYIANFEGELAARGGPSGTGAMPARAARPLVDQLGAASPAAQEAANQAQGGQAVSFADEMTEAVGSPTRASQAGRMLAPDLTPAIEAAQKGAGKVKDAFTMHPGLDKVKMPGNPNMTADYTLAMLKGKAGSEGDIAATKVRQIRTGGTPALHEDLNKVLHYRDLAKRGEKQLNQGLPVKLEGGISVEDAIREAVEAEGRLRATPEGSAFLDEKMRLVDDIRYGDMAPFAIDTKQMGLESVREEYIPHYTEGKFQDQNLPGLVPDSDAKRFLEKGGHGGNHAPIPHPARSILQRGEKFAEGSTDKLIGDPLDRLAIKYAETRRKGYMNEFVERLKPFAITDPDVVSGKTFDPAVHGIYYFGNGEHVVLPKQLAVDIAKANVHPPKAGPVTEYLARLPNKALMAGVLKYNPAYHAKQRLDDPVWAALNVPFGEKRRVFSEARANRKTFLDALQKEAQGEPQDMLTEARRSGIVNEVYETLTDTVDEIRQISEKTRLPSDATGITGLGKRLSALADLEGQAREGGTKKAVYDAWIRQGADPETAARIANETTGNYIYKSAAGKQISDLAPMTRWWRNAVKRLAEGAAGKDPVTGEYFTKRGYSAAAATIVIPAYLATKMWNGAVTGGKDWSGDGPIVPGTKFKIVMPGYGLLAKTADDVIADPIKGAAKQIFGRVTPLLMGGMEAAGVTRRAFAPMENLERAVAPARQLHDIVDSDRGSESALVDMARALSPVNIQETDAGKRKSKGRGERRERRGR